MLWRPTLPDLMLPFACCTLQDTGKVFKGVCHEMDIFLKDNKIKSVHLICALKVFKISLLWWKLILNFLLAAMKLLTNSKNPSSYPLQMLWSVDFDHEKTLVVLKYHNGSRPGHFSCIQWGSDTGDWRNRPMTEREASTENDVASELILRISKGFHRIKTFIFIFLFDHAF